MRIEVFTGGRENLYIVREDRWHVTPFERLGNTHGLGRTLLDVVVELPKKSSIGRTEKRDCNRPP